MWSLEALPRLEAVSRQYFHCLGLGLGLEGHCLGLGLGLALTVLVLCLETKTVQGSGRRTTPFCIKLLFFATVNYTNFRQHRHQWSVSVKPSIHIKVSETLFLKLGPSSTVVGRREKVSETFILLCRYTWKKFPKLFILPCRYIIITRSSFENKVSETKVSETFDDTPEKFRKQSFGNKSFGNFRWYT